MAVHSAPRPYTRAGLVGVALSLFAMLAVQPTQALDAVDYFRGKTIKIYVGYGPGGGNDITARVFAEFFSKHVPGSPKVVVENMPGGGALKAARFVADSQPDGLRILDLVQGSQCESCLERTWQASLRTRWLRWVVSKHVRIHIR